VRETAAKGSKNYLIVQKFIDRGAQIEATETESVDLLRLDNEIYLNFLFISLNSNAISFRYSSLFISSIFSFIAFKLRFI